MSPIPNNVEIIFVKYCVFLYKTSSQFLVHSSDFVYFYACNYSMIVT